MDPFRVATVLLAGCGLASLATGCGASSPPGTASGSYLVGAPIPDTGPQAEAGAAVYNGEELAATEINASGGVRGRRIVLRRRDDGCNPQAAAKAARGLLSDGVQAMVGNYCSDAALAAGPLVAHAVIPNLQPDANSPALSRAGWTNLFLLDPNGTGNATTAAAFFTEVLRAHTVVVADDESGYGRSIASLAARELAARGITVAAVQEVPADSTDLGRLVAAVQRTHADGLYWTGYYAQGATLVRQLRAAGNPAVFVAADGAVDPAFITRAGADAEGTYATAAPTSQFLTGPMAEAFDAAYRARYHTPPGPYSAYGYDAIYVLAHAARSAGSLQPQKVIAALRGTQLAGVTGSISFAADGSRQGVPFVVLAVTQGEYRLAEHQPGR